MNSAVVDRAGSVDEVLDLYRNFGDDCYDETVTQLDHALQCAAHARADSAAPELIAAALLHDVGHLLDLAGRLDSASEEDPTSSRRERTEGADLKHEQSGSRYLSALFSPSVTRPVAMHVRAKRYLCGVRPGYLATLSEGSVLSLARQGGPMNPVEVAAFEANPAAADAIRLRRWDDLGKLEGVEVAGLNDYRELLSRLASVRPSV